MSTGRRHFLQASTGGFLLLKPSTVFGTQANSAIELGVIGCGGRGAFVGGLFTEFTGARIAALADPFPGAMDAAKATLRAPSAKTFAGLNGYKDLLASSVDAVAIMSPPYFHPEQAKAAVDAGKHVYIAKPIAVDVPGCQSILASAQQAKGKSSFLVDFQTRSSPAFQEAAQRVHAGQIGAPALGHVYYHTGRLRSKAQPGMPPAEARLRNWVFDKILSGDIIVEQNIHVLDVANWYLRSHPLKAMGTGGRKVRVDVGDCWDHFTVNFWYPDEVKVDFSSAQFIRGYDDLCIRVYGSKGTVDSHYGGAVRITGDTPWTGSEKDNTGRIGASENVKAFVESIRSRRFLNNAEVSVESNLTAILGRMAAYREGTVTWDEMMQSGEKLMVDLRL